MNYAVWYPEAIVFFSSVSVFLPLANGVTLHFLLEVATVQLSWWCVGSLVPVVGLWYFHVLVFFSAYVESVALFIKYVSPVLVIFIGGICMISRFIDGRLLCRFLFPLAGALEHFHWSTVSHVRLGRLHRRNWSRAAWQPTVYVPSCEPSIGPRTHHKIEILTALFAHMI